MTSYCVYHQGLHQLWTLRNNERDWAPGGLQALTSILEEAYRQFGFMVVIATAQFVPRPEYASGSNYLRPFQHFLIEWSVRALERSFGTWTKSVEISFFFFSFLTVREFLVEITMHVFFTTVTCLGSPNFKVAQKWLVSCPPSLNPPVVCKEWVLFETIISLYYGLMVDCKWQ